VIKIYRKTLQSKLKEVEEIRNGVWLNVERVSKEELAKLAELYELELPDIDDVMDPHELPRIERHGGTIVVFVRVPSDGGTEVRMILMNEKYLATVGSGKNELMRKILERNGMPPTTQQSKLFAYMMLMLTREYTKGVKKILDESDKLRKFSEVNRKDVVKLVQYEETLRQYLAALVPLRNVLKPITEGKYIKLHEDDKDLFEDLYNSITQSVDTCRVQVESIQSLRDAHQIIFTNELNNTMKFLASFTVLLTIPMIVTSAYGMNVELPIADEPQIFWLLAGISIALTLVFGIWLSKRKWS
jgi:magnesium transporter